jgi:hypothetical protein
MMEGVNSTMIYSKNFSKYHNVSPEQQQWKRTEMEHLKGILFSLPWYWVLFIGLLIIDYIS